MSGDRLILHFTLQEIKLIKNDVLSLKLVFGHLNYLDWNNSMWTSCIISFKKLIYKFTVDEIHII